MLIDLGLEENDNSSDKPPDAFWHCNAAEAGSEPEMQRTEYKEGGVKRCMKFFAHAKHF